MDLSHVLYVSLRSIQTTAKAFSALGVLNAQQWLTFLCSRLVNIAVGIIMILGGISQFFPASMSAVIVGVYVIIFGLGK